MPSEGLIQRNLLNNGLFFGDYEYYSLGDVSLNQLKNALIIPNLDYSKYEARKPDGLIVDRQNKKNTSVIAVVEYKDKGKFWKEEDKKLAVEQCNDICQVLNAKIGIITDGDVTFWINPLQQNQENEYQDRTTGKNRSYSFIIGDDKQKLQTSFQINQIPEKNPEKLPDPAKDVYESIKRVLSETSPKSSILKTSEITDPTSLAKNVWQSIYIVTKANPTACLYNVVEIFIFKFLSDLGILERDFSFSRIMEMYDSKYPAEEVIRHYADVCRVKIKELFPAGDDGTTIINGTIFVDKHGRAVLSQATLFKDTIEKYNNFGNLKNIKKEFKTKLFETFLKESKDKSKLGQFFTPRKVVKAIVEMVDIDKANFICDPFCGVGGFVLEPLQHSSTLKNKFRPIEGKINSNVKIEGYDTGREDDEEQKRTIILAKANMVIYLSDIIEKSPNLCGQFSNLINNSFHFLSKSNLGTLEKMYNLEEEKPDLIIANPPYISSGVQSIKKEIETAGLEGFYLNSGKGVEGLCMRWIISNLRIGGQAFIVLPEGIFDLQSNQVLRDELLSKCYIDCIISLPSKTFFTTPKKTYILGIRKKHNIKERQDTPVFTYINSSIGETLDVNRFEIENNDLDKCKNLYNQFKGSKYHFETTDARCKIKDIEYFYSNDNWKIDNLWSDDEKFKLGITDKVIFTPLLDLPNMLDEISENILNFKKEVADISVEITNDYTVKNEKLKDLFEIKSGDSKITKSFVNKNLGEFVVYSANTKENGVFGYIKSFDYDTECIQITTNGVYAGTVFYRNKHKFSINGDARLLIKNNPKLDYLYLTNAIRISFLEYNFNWENKPTIEKIKDIQIAIPIDSKGEYDLEVQKEIAEKYQKIEEIKAKAIIELEKIQSFKIDLGF